MSRFVCSLCGAIFDGRLSEAADVAFQHAREHAEQDAMLRALGEVRDRTAPGTAMADPASLETARSAIAGLWRAKEAVPGAPAPREGFGKEPISEPGATT